MGLSARFTDVILDNCAIGESYSLIQEKSLPLTLVNNSSAKMKIKVAVEAPTGEELRDNYEIIPDPSWVKVVPNEFSISAGGVNRSDIIVNIPNDPDLIGKRYQVMIWGHTVDDGFLGIGVRLRVRFDIGTRYSSLKIEDSQVKMEPFARHIGEVPVGKKINLSQSGDFVFKVINLKDHEIELTQVKDYKKMNQVSPENYEAVEDISWIKISPKKMKIASKSEKLLKVSLKVPKKKEYRGRNFSALLRFSALVGEELESIYSQILFKTEE